MQKVWLQPDKRYVYLGVIYYVGQVPIFYLPFLLSTEIGTGIRTLFGYNKSQGFYFQNSYYYGFPKSTLLPWNGVLMFDFYQYDGFYAGTYMNKRSNNLDYDITLGIASRIVRDTISLTNGAISSVTEPWYEINANINPHWSASMDKDSLSALNLKFEYYNNKSFNRMFKQRTEPTDTINSIAYNRILYSNASDVNSLTWQAVYSENWLDNSFIVTINKIQQWANYYKGYAYYPYSDTFPSLKYTKKWYLVKPSSSWFQGISNDILIQTGIENQFDQGKLYHVLDYYNINSGFSAYFPFHSIISFTPTVGYGVQGQFYQNETPSEKIENGKKSFQSIFTRASLSIGPSFLNATATHGFRWATVETVTNSYFDKERENKFYFALSSDLAPFGIISLSTARDMRKFPGLNREQDHWDPINSSLGFLYDFINPESVFLADLYNPNKHFMGIGLSESFLYNINFNTPGSNTVDIFFQTGGYRFLFFQNVENLKTGFTWVHDFLNHNKNRILAQFHSRLHFLKYWVLDFQISANVYHTGTEASPYQNVGEALINIFNPAYTSSPMELNQVAVVLEHDLHDWTLQIEYSLTQTWLPFGTSSQKFAGYYDQGIYVTFTLKGLKDVGIPRTQIQPGVTPLENLKAKGLY